LSALTLPFKPAFLRAAAWFGFTAGFITLQGIRNQFGESLPGFVSISMLAAMAVHMDLDGTVLG